MQLDDTIIRFIVVAYLQQGERLGLELGTLVTQLVSGCLLDTKTNRARSARRGRLKSNKEKK